MKFDVQTALAFLHPGSMWTLTDDAPVDAQAWADYRQALRDIPQDFDSPDDVVWPEAP